MMLIMHDINRITPGLFGLATCVMVTRPSMMDPEGAYHGDNFSLFLLRHIADQGKKITLCDYRPVIDHGRSSQMGILSAAPGTSIVESENQSVTHTVVKRLPIGALEICIDLDFFFPFVVSFHSC
jgi:hypothetical protein